MDRLWNRYFIAALASRLFSSMVFAGLSACMISYSLETYHVGEGGAGALTGSFICAALFSRLSTSMFAVRFGRRRTFLVSSALCLVFMLAYLLPLSLPAFFATRVIHGACYGVFHNMLCSEAINFIPRGKMGEGIGYFSVGSSLGNVFGPLASLFLMYEFGAPAVFAAFSGLSFAALALVAILPVEELLCPSEEKVEVGIPAKRQESLLAHFIDVGALPIAAAIFGVSLCSGSLTAFIEPYAKLVGLTGALPVFFAANCLTVAVSRPIMGQVIDNHSPLVSVVPSIISIVLAFLVLPFAHNSLMVAASAMLFGFGYGSSTTTWQTLVIRHAPRSRIDVATATVYAASDAGIGLGPTIMGFIVAGFNYQTMMLACAVVAVLSFGVYAARLYQVIREARHA